MAKFKTVLSFGLCFLSLLFIPRCSSAAESDLEYTVDANSATVPLPKMFVPNIDLSGRGFHRDVTWPQSLAAPEVLDSWAKDVGFRGVYRMQYNFWGISQLKGDKQAQDRLLANYESVIKRISDSGGIVILDIFSIPQGQGKVLDKTSSPADLKAFKQLVKSHIRQLSCNKKYNIWYEVWSAPDLDAFFLGRQQEYLNLYKAVAESAGELEKETKINIPVGGPSVSWWFNSVEGNNIISPGKSLIYELIKFCYTRQLPLDFISWHAYSTDPKTEKETTTYNKVPATLIRDWLSYFHFPGDTPLIVDEWNYDSGANIIAERKGLSHIAASFVPSRIKNMYESGIDYQLYFCLEDFQDNPEGVVRNIGAFWFEQSPESYKGAPKSIYNVFRMLALLGNNLIMPSAKFNDEFADIIATKTKDDYLLLIYNYIDPDIFRNYLSRNLSLLNEAERKAVLTIVKSDRLDKIMRRELDLSALSLNNKVQNLFKKALELNDSSQKLKANPRNLKLGFKNLKENQYLYVRYCLDSSCAESCDFKPLEEKEINPLNNLYQEDLVLEPYSVNLIILKKKPEEPEPARESEVAANITLEKPAGNPIKETANLTETPVAAEGDK
jgi:hypothetical protein